MNPKERRKRLFGEQHPIVRKIQLNDLRWLYGAHKLSGGELTQEEFSEFFARESSCYEEIFVIDDFNAKYKNKWGAIGIMPCKYDGWRLEPVADWFPWATPKNILRSSVAFLLYCRYSKDIGVTLIHSPDNNKEFFKKIKQYVSLYPLKPIPGGMPEGNDNMFYIRGKKKHGTI